MVPTRKLLSEGYFSQAGPSWIVWRSMPVKSETAQEGARPVGGFMGHDLRRPNSVVPPFTPPLTLILVSMGNPPARVGDARLRLHILSRVATQCCTLSASWRHRFCDQRLQRPTKRRRQAIQVPMSAVVRGPRTHTGIQQRIPEKRGSCGPSADTCSSAWGESVSTTPHRAERTKLPAPSHFSVSVCSWKPVRLGNSPRNRMVLLVF